MEITIKYFGMIADATGKSEETIKTDLQNVAGVEKFLVDRYPSLTAMNYSIAKNASICNTNEIVNEGDILAFLPPFAGG